MEENRYLRRYREHFDESNAVVTPICIVVDTSHSMVDGRFVDRSGKTRMQRLNEGLSQFIEEIKKDDLLFDSVEIAVVTFNTVAEVAFDFSSIGQIGNIDISGGSSSGDTPRGVELALEVLQREKQRLIASRKRYNQPWLVIMSDGRATPGRDALNPLTGKKDFTDINRRMRIVQDKTKSLERDRKLTVIPVLISEMSDSMYHVAKKEMQGFTIENRCKEIGDGATQVSFREFFKILGRSVSVSNAEVMFSDSDVNEKVGYSSEPSDYVSQEEIAKFFLQPLSKSSAGSNRQQVRPKEDDFDEIERLKNDAMRAPIAPENFDDDVPDIFLSQQDESFVEEKELLQDVPKSESRENAAQDEDYLTKLLDGIVDWDEI